MTAWNQKPKPDPVHDQMNSVAATLPFTIRRHRVGKTLSARRSTFSINCSSVERVDLEDITPPSPMKPEESLDVDEALKRFATGDPDTARLVSREKYCMEARTFFRFSSFVGSLFVALLLSVRAGLSQTPTTSNGWFQLFQAKNDLTWSGSDQATSYRASNGKAYWLFGDTILGTRNPATGGYNPGWYMVANTILLESNGVLSGATSTSPAVPNASNGDRYWGQGVFEANGYVFVLCERVHNTNNAIGFITLGAELAKFQFESNGQLAFLGMVSTPGTGITQGTGAATIQWTDDAVVYAGYVYIFGDAGTGVYLSPKAGYVSRVVAADVENTNSWTFWNGSSWVANMLNSAPIIADMPSSVRLYGGKWVILYKPFAGAGDQVKVVIGSAPQGPYPSGQVIFQSPGGTTSNGVTTTLHCYQTYNPQSHSEYPLSSGKLLVSIAWNGCDLFNDTANDAQLYKPRFYEIALTGISDNPFTQWQLKYFGCTDCPQAAETADPDGDGQNNLAEFLSGTDPTKSASFFGITSSATNGSNIRIAWKTAGGKTNMVQGGVGDLDNNNPSYSNLFYDMSEPIIIPGGGDAVTNFTDDGSWWGDFSNWPTHYYRVRLVP